MYASEANLIQVFNNALLEDTSPFSPENTASEFDYREGRTDVILQDVDGSLVAFEMKLSKWRQALHQAYRNSSFAHYSYVVLPLSIARVAVGLEHEFRRRGVGLCSVANDEITIEIEAKRMTPLRPWLTKSAIEYLFREEVYHSQHTSSM